VILFGAYLWNKTGVCVSRWGKVGEKIWNLGYWPYADVQRQWFSAVHPDVFIFNGGSNDAGASFSIADLSPKIANVNTIIHQGDPQIKVFYINPYQSANTTQNSFVDSYKTYFQQLTFATSNAYWLDLQNTDAMGTYANAVANDWMLDTAHANHTGALRCAAYLIQNIRPARTFFGTAPPTPGPGEIGDTYISTSGPGTVYTGITLTPVTGWLQIKP
jgi:hypothetical protein